MKRLGLGLLTIAALWGTWALSAREQAPGPLQVDRAEINPWTHLDLKNRPENFQFAIVTDRTGGHRVRVFEKAVQKLNMLQPEFVISVGDLIEGYSEDPAQIDREWSEFQSFVKQLKMPFFFVPGNHDYANALQQTQWKQRMGRPYYHFVYHNVLFLALNSEVVTKDKLTALGEEQLAYVRKAVLDNPQVRWTFIFLHKPLWAMGDGGLGAGTGWPELEQALAGRKFTAFCGHIHRYQTWQRNGNWYIQLATTGGSSKLRGKDFGEFDQIAWVTLNNDGPQITNMLLDGLVGVDLQADLALDKEIAAAQEVQRQEIEKARQERAAKEAQKKAEAEKKKKDK